MRLNTSCIGWLLPTNRNDGTCDAGTPGISRASQRRRRVVEGSFHGKPQGRSLKGPGEEVMSAGLDEFDGSFRFGVIG
jgi:hypothetical protein